jgi:hypothetical protein
MVSKPLLCPAHDAREKDANMKRTELRERNDGTWCELQVELQELPNGLRLSICGSAGVIVKQREARKMALEHWESFFDDSPSERHAMNDKFCKNFRTSKSAARFVIQSDGEYHGLDVHREDGSKVYLLHSCGQITEELKEWFPEVEPYLKWHLNDMRSECEHQASRGETWGTRPSAKCPDCGYVLGSAWKRRGLPADVIAWARGEKKAA